MPVSSAMKTHLASGATTLCSLVKLQPRLADGSLGTAILVTSHTRQLTYLSETYLPVYLDPTQLQTTVGLAADNARFKAPAVSPIDPPKLRGHQWLDARVEINNVNYLDLTMGPSVRKVGRLGDVNAGQWIFDGAFRSLASLLNQPIGDYCMEHCIVAELGDTQCGVDLSGNTVDGHAITSSATVTAVTDKQQFTVGLSPARPDDFFLKGRAIWLTGNNAGLRERVMWNTGNAIVLFLPMANAIQIGDTLNLIAGCDRSRNAGCRDKFNNVERFRGFPDLPGLNALLAFPP
jgi:uncharacterized phage protein (TIGR02218 family)